MQNSYKNIQEYSPEDYKIISLYALFWWSITYNMSFNNKFDGNCHEICN